MSELIGQEIKGSFTIDRIVFDSKDSNGFKIVALKPNEIESGKLIEDDYNTYGNISAMGNLQTIKSGESVNLTMKRKLNNNQQYGKYQFDIVFSFQRVDLQDIQEQKTYLSIILTEKQIENLYNTFDNPYEILINHNKEELVKVKGIGERTAEKIFQKIDQTRDYSSAYSKLSKLGLTIDAINKLIEQYQSPNLLVEKITENPYILVEEVVGYGFKRADAIAKQLGVKGNSRHRIKSYILYLFYEHECNGNSWMTPVDIFGGIYQDLTLDSRCAETNII